MHGEAGAAGYRDVLMGSDERRASSGPEAASSRRPRSPLRFQSRRIRELVKDVRYSSTPVEFCSFFEVRDKLSIGMKASGRQLLVGVTSRPPPGEVAGRGAFARAGREGKLFRFPSGMI